MNPPAVSQQSKDAAVGQIEPPPPITHALEALLGGLDEPAEKVQAEDVQMEDETDSNALQPEHFDTAFKIESTENDEAALGPKSAAKLENAPDQVGSVLEEARKETAAIIDEAIKEKGCKLREYFFCDSADRGCSNGRCDEVRSFST